MTTITFITALAVYGFHLIFIHEFHFPDILLDKFEWMLLWDYLQLVWELVGAHLIYIKQVNDLFLFADMKIPNTI
jgi:hypothetical protein